MLENMPNRDLRTQAYVLRRTNYGEADRILTLITPKGKITAIAKGARKEKSKLAGGIEVFSLVDLNLHIGKSDFAIVTGAKMVRHYGDILKDFARMELAGVILKRISVLSDSSDNPEYFEIVDQALRELNAATNTRLIKSWFIFNTLKAAGEEINLYRDTAGEKLKVEQRYQWDTTQNAFSADAGGVFGAEEIKMLRLMSTVELSLIKRVKVSDELIDRVVNFALTIGNV